MSFEAVIDWIKAICLIAGTLLMALGAIGILRMPDVYTRIQAASKTSTLGLALVFITVALHFTGLAPISQALAVIAFAFLSVPVAAHMISRAAHGAGVELWPPGSLDELREAHEALEEEPPPE